MIEMCPYLLGHTVSQLVLPPQLILPPQLVLQARGAGLQHGTGQGPRHLPRPGPAFGEAQLPLPAVWPGQLP